MLKLKYVYLDPWRLSKWFSVVEEEFSGDVIRVEEVVGARQLHCDVAAADRVRGTRVVC